MATKVNLIIDQGSDFSQEFAVLDAFGNPIDLTGYDIAAGMRKSYESELFIPFQCIGYSNGIIQISMSAADTTILPYGQYVWDMKSVSPAPSNITKRLYEGMVQLTPRVTW